MRSLALIAFSFFVMPGFLSAAPPTDAEIIQAVVENHDMKMTGPGCDSACPGDAASCRTVGEYFSRLTALLQGEDPSFGDVQLDITQKKAGTQKEPAWEAEVLFSVWDEEKKFKEWSAGLRFLLNEKNHALQKGSLSCPGAS